MWVLILVACGAEPFVAHRDADGDGYGREREELVTELVPGFVLEGGDCDDRDTRIHPGLEQDGCVDGQPRDMNCDGDTTIDGMDEFFVSGGYEDNDGDGVGGEHRSWSMCAEAPEEVDPDVHRPGDCDDSDPTVFPDAPELCDGIDHDCDGQRDNGC